MEEINYWAVVIAAIVFVAIGFIWYAPFGFGPIWAKMTNNKNVSPKSMALASIGSVITSFISAWVLAYIVKVIQIDTSVGGLGIGFLVWLGFIFTTMIAAVIYSKKPFKLFAIEVGYYLVSYLLMGTILGAWK